MQEDEPSAFVAYDKFESVVIELVESGEFAPDSEDTLLAAFRVRHCDQWVLHADYGSYSRDLRVTNNGVVFNCFVYAGD